MIIFLATNLAVYLGLLATKMNYCNRLLQKTIGLGEFFEIASFVSENNAAIKHLKGDFFELKDFNVQFNAGSLTDRRQYQNYFYAREKISFCQDQGEFFASIGNMRLYLPFPIGAMEIKETFIDEAYGYFDVKDFTVVDLGGFIGDTAIFFANKGARRVLSYEPAPFLYEFAKKNILSNGLSDRVELINACVCDKDGLATLNFSESPGASSIIFSIYPIQRFECKMISLDSIIANLGRVDLLKVDIEGAEWSMFRGSVKAMEAVDRIIVEVHGNNNVHGSNKAMQELLRQLGFQIKRNIINTEYMSLISAEKKR